MLVVKVEVWPGGDVRRAKKIHTIHIGNVSNLAPVSDYEVFVDGKPYMIRGHKREDGALALIKKVLEKAV